MTTLSLCMIVRDAKRSLGQALASAKPFVDEMVVVDTGSIDGTRQIALEMGARVFDFAWCDSFSAARNYSLDQATGEWIFWMDADDVLPPQSGQELRRLIESCPERNAAFWVAVEEARRSGNNQRVTAHGHVKLFPRDERIRFRYRIHEQINPAINELGLPIRGSKAVVRHLADRSPEAQAARRDRNLRLALLDQQDHPDDPFVLLALGTTHLSGQAERAAGIDFVRQCIARSPRGSQIQLNAYLHLAGAFSKAGDQQSEEQTYREALTIFPDDGALLSRLGSLYDRTGRLEEAVKRYEEFLERGRRQASAIQIRGSRVAIAVRVGELYIHRGERGRAEQLWRSFLERQPSALAIRRALERLIGQSPADTKRPVAACQGPESFLFVITGHNVQSFLPRLVESLAGQRWPTWNAVFIDDASTDRTADTLRALIARQGLAERFAILENAERKYKSFNVFQALQNRGRAEDVVVMLDGDDSLAGSEALSRLAREYGEGWEVVWSNWRGTDGSRGTSSHLNPFVIARRQRFVSSHLFSFRRRLFQTIAEADFKDDDGQWFRAGCDVALAWPILEQTIKRKHIEDVLYVYNRDNPLSHEKCDVALRASVTQSQAKTCEILRRRRGQPLVVDNGFLHAHLYEFLQAATLSLRREMHHETSPLGRAGTAR